MEKFNTLMTSLMNIPGIKTIGSESGLIVVDTQQIMKDGMRGGNKPEPHGDRYLTFTSTGESTLSMGRKITREQLLQISIEYKLNDGDWTVFVPTETTIEMQDGDVVKMRGNNTGFYYESGKSYDRLYFTMTGSIAASGDIASLLNGEGGDCELTEYCYRGMFDSCSSLTTAPELPAKTLAQGCYYNMFTGCTSLTTAPELPAETLVEYCYQNMFSDCTSLSNVTCLATDISATDCTYNWLQNVSSTGTFTKAASMDKWPTNSSDGIPSGWTVQNYAG